MATIFENDDVSARAFRCARGSYQYALLNGNQQWSGAGLKGEARHWSVGYAESRRSLMARLRKAGVSMDFLYLRRGGQKIMVVKP
jgi:hypothetical protein